MGRRKRGWNKASSLSLSDLQRLVEAKMAQIEQLKVRRDEVASTLADIDAELAAEGNKSTRGRKPAKRGPGRPRTVGQRRGRKAKTVGRPKGKRRGRKAGKKGQSDLHEAIRSALKGASEPMKLADLAAKVKAGGYKTVSANFPMIVGFRLKEMKDVKKAGRGMYAMK